MTDYWDAKDDTFRTDVVLDGPGVVVEVEVTYYLTFGGSRPKSGDPGEPAEYQIAEVVVVQGEDGDEDDEWAGADVLNLLEPEQVEALEALADQACVETLAPW
jgi:hypothetical protein